MVEENIVVRSQLIPLHDMRLVLPNTAIAEVIAFHKPEAIEDSPAWLLGLFSWRGVKIPLISYETAVQEQNPEMHRRSRVVVLNSLTGSEDTPFYGLLVQGIPRLMGLDNSNILDAPDSTTEHDFMLRRVLVEGHPAIIPNQKAIESALQDLGVKVIEDEQLQVV